jgi:molecular chaperone HtpG
MCTLDDYVGRMKPGQDAIYYITGDSEETLVKSPQLEGFRSRGVEVLLLTDPVDDFWLPAVGEWQDKPFKSATRGGADFSAMSKDKGEDTGKDKIDDSEDQIPVEISSLISMIKLELGETIKDVRASSRLTDSPVCLIADDGDIDINLERLLRQHRQIHEQVPRVLEINPNHPVIVALSQSIGKKGSGAAVTDVAWLLLDQARILEGEPLPDPSAFSRRFNALLEKSVLE